jgi:hypothetical protein
MTAERQRGDYLGIQRPNGYIEVIGPISNNEAKEQRKIIQSKEKLTVYHTFSNNVGGAIMQIILSSLIHDDDNKKRPKQEK